MLGRGSDGARSVLSAPDVPALSTISTTTKGERRSLRKGKSRGTRASVKSPPMQGTARRSGGSGASRPTDPGSRNRTKGRRQGCFSFEGAGKFPWRWGCRRRKRTAPGQG